MDERLSALTRAGVSVWLDDLSRERLTSGSLAELVKTRHVTGVTGRVSIEVDTRLDKIGTPRAAALRGRAAIANARLAYQRYEQMTAGHRWHALADAGARPQRPLWASTSTKDPAYPDTRYVTEMVAPNVVNTMPEATLRAVADHTEIPGDSIRGTYRDAHAVLDQLAAIGIDYDDVVTRLEDDGIAKFDAAWRALATELDRTLNQATAGR